MLTVQFSAFRQLPIVVIYCHDYWNSRYYVFEKCIICRPPHTIMGPYTKSFSGPYIVKPIDKILL